MHTQIVDTHANQIYIEKTKRDNLAAEKVINENILTWREQLKKYEYKNSDLDCYSIDEYVGIDDCENTGETLSLEDIVLILWLSTRPIQVTQIILSRKN